MRYWAASARLGMDTAFDEKVLKDNPISGQVAAVSCGVFEDAAVLDLDVVGHYARPDIFRLEVDTRPKPPV